MFAKYMVHSENQNQYVYLRHDITEAHKCTEKQRAFGGRQSID